MAAQGIIEEKGHKGTQDITYKREILCPFYVPFCQLCPGQELIIVGGVREVQRSVLSHCVAAQGIIDKKGHKRDICPFLTTMPWAGNKYCGRSQRGKRSPF